MPTRGSASDPLPAVLQKETDFFLHTGDIAYADDSFLHSVATFGYESVYDQVHPVSFTSPSHLSTSPSQAALATRLLRD